MDRPCRPAAASTTLTVASNDKVLSFQLSARPGGITVQRTERQNTGRRLVQSVRFDDEAAFVRWCRSDEQRFTYPLLFSNLTRSGCELFGRKP